jgi:hypothetical protein
MAFDALHVQSRVGRRLVFTAGKRYDLSDVVGGREPMDLFMLNNVQVEGIRCLYAARTTLGLLGFACREGFQPGTSLQFYGTEVACRNIYYFVGQPCEVLPADEKDEHEEVADWALAEVIERGRERC